VRSRRSEVDDVTGTPGTHEREDGRDPVQGAPQVHVDHLVPLVDAQGLQRRQGHHARVVDEHVDAAVPLVGGVREGAHAVEARHIEFPMFGSAAGRADLVGEGLEPVDAAGAEYDLVAVRRQPAGGRLADAAARSRDENDLVIKAAHEDSRKA
jgi:hypothetical protein